MDKDKKTVNYYNSLKLRKSKLIRENNYKKIIIDKKNVNMQYFLYFVKKYCRANGIKFKKDNFDIEEFQNWIHEYTILTNNYRDFLHAYDIRTDLPNVAELGKGRLDAIITSDSYEISEFAETMKRPKLILDNPYKGLLIYQDKRIITLDDLGIDTIITQNPNYNSEIENISILSNELQMNIAFGIYGSFSDRDANRKTKMIKYLLNNTDNTVFNYDTDKDYFYMSVISKPKIKNKVLSL